ncbi:FecR family protein [uncultured Chitinophaga sp.]|uniref:FecR family protein n=1 Tax=uncultured Chitinophaga sp. TaxID=339340 RepID=UPI0025E8E65B|nr:FecR family protein [uncultured Chitinophaga sp.]
MEPRERFAYLAARATSHSATAAELDELCALLAAMPAEEIPPQLDFLLRDAAPVAFDAAHWNNIATRILAADRPAAAKVIPIHRRSRWMWAAAGAALAITTGAYLFKSGQATNAPAIATQNTTPLITPGGNKATLVLGDGSSISLDSAANGALSQQGNAKVVKLANGQLAYQSAQQSSAQPILYNTIVTPRGGKYQVMLPDGSKVWLNAASSLRYPTAFNGSRHVELTGEAYFEIAQDAGKPFIVTNGSTSVEVLGTQFNMMGYADETSTNTTLLSGAVKVNGQKITPGQCASINHNSGKLEVINNVNTEAAIAWKNGYIQFEGNDIRSAMRLISRWYDVAVEYRGHVPSHFRGTIPSNVPVSEVLKMMEMTEEVKFEISGRTIIVSPGK